MTRRLAAQAIVAGLAALAMATAGEPASAATTVTSTRTTAAKAKSPCDKGVLSAVGSVAPGFNSVCKTLAPSGKPSTAGVTAAGAATGQPGPSTSVASSAANAAGSLALGSVAAFFVSGATDALKLVEQAATDATAPELTSGWFQGTFAWVSIYAGAALALAMLGAIMAALFRRRGEGVAEAVLEVLLAGFLIGSTIALAELVLAVSNGISQDIVTALPHGWFDTLQNSWGNAGSSAFVLIAALVGILVIGVLFVELILADAILYIALIFLPIALALGVSPPLAGIRRKLLHVLGMVIFLKPCVLLVLVIGVEVLAGGLGLGGGVASIGTALAGVGAITLAAFAPWAIMHMLGAGPLQYRARRHETTSTGNVGGGLSGGSDPFGGSNGSAGSSAGSTAAIGAGALAAGSAVVGAGQQMAAHVAGRAHAAGGSGSSVDGWTLPGGARNGSQSGNGSVSRKGGGSEPEGQDGGQSQNGSGPDTGGPSGDLLDVFANANGGQDDGSTQVPIRPASDSGSDSGLAGQSSDGGSGGGGVRPGGDAQPPGAGEPAGGSGDLRRAAGSDGGEGGGQVGGGVDSGRPGVRREQG